MSVEGGREADESWARDECKLGAGGRYDGRKEKEIEETTGGEHVHDGYVGIKRRERAVDEGID